MDKDLKESQLHPKQNKTDIQISEDDEQSNKNQKKRFKWDIPIHSLLSTKMSIPPPKMVKCSSTCKCCDKLQNSKSDRTTDETLKFISQQQHQRIDKSVPLLNTSFPISVNMQSNKKQKKQFKWDIPIHSLLSAKAEIPPPKIVEYSSVYEYCDNLKNSKSHRTTNEKIELISQQNLGVDKSVPSLKFGNVKKPYFPISVEELSLVTNIDNWTNDNIRVCGVVREEGYSGIYYLESIDEDDGPFKVSLDLNFLTRIPPINKVLQIFAQLVVVSSKPVIKAIFYRDFSNVNLSLHRTAEEKFKSFVPMFINQKKHDEDCSKSCDPVTIVMNDTLDDFCNLLDEY